MSGVVWWDLTLVLRLTMGRVVRPVQRSRRQRRTSPAGRPENTSDDDVPPSLLQHPGPRPSARRPPGNMKRKYQVKHRLSSPLRLTASAGQDDEVILDILGPLHATLMKGGAVVLSLTRHHRIYFRTWQKWFPCVKHASRDTLIPSPSPPSPQSSHQMP